MGDEDTDDERLLHILRDALIDSIILAARGERRDAFTDAVAAIPCDQSGEHDDWVRSEPPAYTMKYTCRPATIRNRDRRLTHARELHCRRTA